MPNFRRTFSRSRSLVAKVLPLDEHLALIRLEQGDEVLEEHAFPAATPPDDDDRLAALDAQ
jgi:hypothetical protein